MTTSTETTTASNEQLQFVEHLERASRIVRRWPKWKQTVLGNIGAQESCPTQCSQSTGGNSTGQCSTHNSDQP
jgi:hypothetical protein